MGGCASKPRDLDTTANEAPAPVEAMAIPDAPAVPETPIAAAAAPEEAKEDAVETKNEEPLVDSSEPAPVKGEEAKEEAVKTETEQANAETKPIVEAKEEKKEVA